MSACKLRLKGLLLSTVTYYGGTSGGQVWLTTTFAQAAVFASEAAAAAQIPLVQAALLALGHTQSEVDSITYWTETGASVLAPTLAPVNWNVASWNFALNLYCGPGAGLLPGCAITGLWVAGVVIPPGLTYATAALAAADALAIKTAGDATGIIVAPYVSSFA